MSKKLLSGPYLMWMIGFTIIPLALIVFYGLTDRSGAFTLANVLSIATVEHRKALWLSLGLSLVSTIICFILAYPLALILRSRGIGQGSFIVFIFILPAAGLSRRVDFERQRFQASRPVADAHHPADVDEFPAAHAGMADASGEERSDQRNFIGAPSAGPGLNQHTGSHYSRHGI